MKKTINLVHKNKALALVAFTVFVDMLGFGILVPLIPLLIIDPHFSGSVVAQGMTSDIRYIIFGLLIALFPFTQLFATPILGDISDTVGRKRVLALSLGGTFVAYLLLIIGVTYKNLPVLFLARAIDGLSGGNLSVAQASVADISTKKTRARNFAFLSAAFGMGFVLGPLLGIHLTGVAFSDIFGLTAPFWAALLLTGINIALLVLFLPETKKKVFTASHIQWAKAILHIKQALQMRGVRLYFAVNFLLQGAFATMTAFLSVFVISRIGLSESQFGFVLSYLGVWMAIGQITLTRFFIEKFGEKRAFYLCLVGLSLTILLLFIPQSFIGFLLFTPFVSLFLGLSQAFLLSLISGSVSVSKQGEVLGINTSITALAHTIPPIMGGVAAAAFNPSTPIVFAAACTFIASLLVKRRVKAVL